MATIQGYINLDWSKQYLDNLKTPLNNNVGDSSANIVGFNTYNSTSNPAVGTAYLIQVYNTLGNQLTYLDAANNIYYLCASVNVSSSTPTSSGKGTGVTYSATSTNTVTLFGQYFGTASPSLGPVSGVNAYYGSNYYQIWNQGIPIGNPSFAVNTTLTGETNINSSSLYLTDVNTANGVYVSTVNPSSTVNVSNWSNSITYAGAAYNISSTYYASTGDLSSTDTNIFTNRNNTSTTYASSSSTAQDTTYYTDYTSNNYYQKKYGSTYSPVTAGYIKVTVTVTSA